MIVHVVGNRPQFIKLAPLYHEMERRGYPQMIIHTGQHYDSNLSEIFFEELDIPAPTVNLGVGSGSHAEITSAVMLKLEHELLRIRPDLIVVYGDTDSTLGAAITARKLQYKLCHIEGGSRTHNSRNPEEQNRICTDHLSNVIFGLDRSAIGEAEREGLGDRIYLSGDIMYDTYREVSERQNKKERLYDDNYILMTWHRQENTSSAERMDHIISFVEQLHDRIICPLHPRTVKCLKNYGLWSRFANIDGLTVIEPVGYDEMVGLMNRARLILTDSGGLSRESSYAGSKCLFMVDLDISPELCDIGWIFRVDVDSDESVVKALAFAINAVRVPPQERPQFYGDGHAAAYICNTIEQLKLI